MFTPFMTAILAHHAASPPLDGPVKGTLDRTEFDNAEVEISSWDGYVETPLMSLTGLAGQLGVAEIRYKHEGPRFGLKHWVGPMLSYALFSANCLNLSDGQ
ncbi:MAG: hypothetical protein ABJL99_06215 [Aliishimia sp.]